MRIVMMGGLSNEQVYQMGRFYFLALQEAEISENPAANPSPNSILQDVEKRPAGLLVQDAARLYYVREVASCWCLAAGYVDDATSINRRRRVSYELVAELIAAWFPDGPDDKEVWYVVKALVDDCRDENNKRCNEVSLRKRCWYVKRLLS